MPLDDLSRAAALPEAVQLSIGGVGPAAKPLSERERFVLVLFRHLAVFRSCYQESALESAARHTERYLDREQADDVMAAAVLLDNEIRCQTELSFVLDDLDSPAASPAEHDFLALLKAATAGSDRAAIGACSRLEVADTRTLLACARRLVRALGWTGPSERSTRLAAPMTSPALTGL